MSAVIRAGMRASLMVGNSGTIGQGEGKSGSSIHLALRCDGSTVQLHDMFHDTKAQASAAAFSRASLVDPIESLEEVGKILFWNATSVILHLATNFPGLAIDDRADSDD